MSRETRLRTGEIRLLLFSAAITVVGFWALAISRADDVTLSVDDLRTPALVGGAFLAVSLCWSASGFRGDQVLFPAVTAIAVLGLVMLHRLQPDLTRRNLRRPSNVIPACIDPPGPRSFSSSPSDWSGWGSLERSLRAPAP